MKECAWCGRENDDDALRCRECGTAEFKGDSAKSIESNEPEIETVAEDTYPDLEPDVSFEDDCELCISCLFPNAPGRPFCKRCGAPVNFISTISPAYWPFAMGFGYRQAVRRRPKLIVLIGIWIIFFPGLIAGLFMIPGILFNRYDGLLAIPLISLYNAVSISMVYRVTKNFCTLPKKNFDDTVAD